jgi:hypothetical protein
MECWGEGTAVREQGSGRGGLRFAPPCGRGAKSPGRARAQQGWGPRGGRRAGRRGRRPRGWGRCQGRGRGAARSIRRRWRRGTICARACGGSRVGGKQALFGAGGGEGAPGVEGVQGAPRVRQGGRRGGRQGGGAAAAARRGAPCGAAAASQRCGGAGTRLLLRESSTALIAKRRNAGGRGRAPPLPVQSLGGTRGPQPRRRAPGPPPRGARGKRRPSQGRNVWGRRRCRRRGALGGVAGAMGRAPPPRARAPRGAQARRGGSVPLAAAGKKRLSYVIASQTHTKGGAGARAAADAGAGLPAADAAEAPPRPTPRGAARAPLGPVGMQSNDLVAGGGGAGDGPHGLRRQAPRARAAYCGSARPGQPQAPLSAPCGRGAARAHGAGSGGRGSGAGPV